MPDSSPSFEADRIVIRLARDEDHSAIRCLFDAGSIEGKVPGNDTGVDIDDLRGGYFADDGASGFWVAVLESRVIGMIGVQRTRANTGEIRRLRVDERHRRCGVGTRLMHRAIDHCREQGFLKVVLDVRIERGPAVAMFEKFGFTLVRTREMDDRKTLDFYLDLYRESRG